MFEGRGRSWYEIRMQLGDRSQFSTLEARAYLNHAAIGATPDSVVAAMHEAAAAETRQRAPDPTLLILFKKRGDAALDESEEAEYLPEGLGETRTEAAMRPGSEGTPSCPARSLWRAWRGGLPVSGEGHRRRSQRGPSAPLPVFRNVT